MKRIIVSLWLVVIFCTSASAESLVWKAQKGSSVIYLGGTFHVLRESDFPLPPEFEKAYQASQVVIFETDIGKLQEPATQQRMLKKAMYADGSTIEQHLSAKAFRQLSQYCEDNGIPLQTLSRFKPSMLMTTLTVLELMKMGFSQHGVDDFFYQRAKKDHKAVKGLESVDQQIDYVVSMADGDEDNFVAYSLQDMQTIKDDFQEMETAWRTGNAVRLEQLLNAEFKNQQPKLFKKLITDRNRNWMPLIDKQATGLKTRFILVGAGHLVGPEGLVESLRKRGYRVDKL